MQWKETDSKTQAEILSLKITNPDLSTRDLQKETGVSKSTVATIINDGIEELRTTSDIVKIIIENDLESVKNMSEITKKYTQWLKDQEKIERADIQTANQTTESAFKRHQLLTGGNTEKIETNIATINIIAPENTIA